MVFVPDFNSGSMVCKKRTTGGFGARLLSYDADVESLLVQDVVESKSSGDGNGDRGSDGGVYQ